MKQSPVQKSGAQASPAKMYRWRERGQELGLKAKELDSFIRSLNSLAKGFPNASSLKTFQASLLPTKAAILQSSFGRWPSSGMAWRGACLTADTSECPSQGKESTLLDVVEIRDVPLKYFLSPNAARGILRRVESQKRKLFPPLESALRLLAQKRDSQT